MFHRICSRVCLATTLVLSAVVSPAAVAQQGSSGAIIGRVVDASTSRPLMGAQVSLTGTQLGAVTNSDGEYRIPNARPGPYTVNVRLIGFSPASRTVQVEPAETHRVDFELAVSVIKLNEVVVTGTGVAVEQRKLGNTVATVNVADLQNAPISNFSDILQGREPGLVGLPSGGLTGEGARIRIRGNASLSQSNEPIVYVDGVRVDIAGGFGLIGTGGGGTPSRLDDIDPQSIERVEVLKGAAAATLYGTEASNGVIQIFTKKGLAGAPRWNLQLEQGMVTYPDRIKPNVGFARSDTQATRLSEFYGRPIRPFELIEARFNDQLMETGQATTLAASVNGGSQGVVTYYVSGRYYTEDGPFTAAGLGPTTDRVNKIQGTANLSIFPRSDLTLGLRTFFTEGHNDIPGNNNYIYAPFTLAMFGKPERVNCDASMRENPPFGILRPGLCGFLDAQGREVMGPGNPMGQAAFSTVREGLQETIEQDVQHFNGAFNALYVPVPSITLDGTVGLDVVNQLSVAFRPFGNSVDEFSQASPNGERQIDDRNFRQLTLDGKASWNATPAKSLTSTLLLGAQGFVQRTNLSGGYNYDFPGPGLEVVGAGGFPDIWETFLQEVQAGFYAQEQLGWRDWMFGTVGARYDYHSAFGENAGGVLYPKLSASVIPSDWPGWNDFFLSSAFSTLRLRAAIGKSGRQPGAFDKFTTYAPINSATGSGLVPSQLGNQDLRPEISTEREVGAELGFWNNRAVFDLTYWSRRVNDALYARQFPVTGGFRAQQIDNVGKLWAFGWEFKLNGLLVNTPTFTVDAFANASYLYQEVLDLGGAPPLKVGGSYPRYRNFLMVGYAPGSLFGAKLPQPCSARPAGATYLCLQPGQLPYDVTGPSGTPDGKPDTEQELLAYLSQPRTLDALVQLMVDEDGDGDRLDHYLGKPMPDWQGSFGASMSFFRNWRLATLFEYKFGDFTVTNLTDAFRQSNALIGRNIRKAAEAEATLLNPASTAQQRLEAAKIWAYELRALSPYDGLNQNEKGDFLRWREISLTYQAPSDWAARVGARDLSISFTGRNVMLWTGYSGIDPETNVYGRTGAPGVDANFGDAIEAFGFPIPRRFSVSVRLGY